MTIIERPGIDSRWNKYWKANTKTRRIIIANNSPDVIKELESYILHGHTITIPIVEREETNPPRQLWEASFLDTFLSEYAIHSLWKFEMNCIEKGLFDSLSADRIFCAMYFPLEYEIWCHKKGPERFPGRTFQDLDLRHIAYTALGITLGYDKKAFRMARLQISAHRKDYYREKNYFPVMHFIFRILVDYLDEAPLELQGESLTDPVFNTLFSVWKEPDPAILIPVCLAACDIHTHRCRETPPHGFFYDFDHWTRTPIEILLMFKLRQKLGLPNPQLDHPIMTGAFAALPQEVEVEPDDLLLRVHNRMLKDGYDEELIFTECY